MTTFERVHQAVISCTRCPRLVAYREQVAREKRRMYAQWSYWGRPLPGFGDPEARMLVLGLAPAAHGGNRTGRMFTGDRSGDWLYGAMHRFGFANQATSHHRDDGLALRDAYISAALRCAPPANRPLPQELANCQPFLLEELSLLARLQVVIALGKIAFDAYVAACRSRGVPVGSPRPQFAHGASYSLPHGVTLLGCYHPSQRNTQTGLLTVPMFNAVFSTARQILGPEGDRRGPTAETR
jgi:uracil-DNA glycosylase family 4